MFYLLKRCDTLSEEIVFDILDIWQIQDDIQKQPFDLLVWGIDSETSLLNS